MSEIATTAENSALVVEDFSTPVVLAVERISISEESPNWLCVRSFEGDLVYLERSHFLPTQYSDGTDVLDVLHPEVAFFGNEFPTKKNIGLVLAYYPKSSGFSSFSSLVYVYRPEPSDNSPYPVLDINLVEEKARRVREIHEHSKKVAEKNCRNLKKSSY